MRTRPQHRKLMQRMTAMRGMSLVEVMVAAALTLSLCVLVAEISTGMMRGVSTASGRLVASQKLERLRHVLSDDLAKLPLLPDGRSVLRGDSNETAWNMQLMLPHSDASVPWQTVNWRWDSDTGALWREIPGESTEHPVPVLTGLVRWQAQWLANHATDASGPSSWQSTSSLPAALRVKVKLTGRWEEGPAVNHGERGDLREFVLIIPVGGGGV